MTDHVSSPLSNQSRLSSAVTEPEEFFPSQDEALSILNARADGNEGAHVRILRLFLDVLPHDGRKNLYDDVINCQNRLQELRDHIVSALIVTMKAKGQTPVIPRPGADDDLNRIASEMGSSKKVAQLKNDCLERDGWKCIVSGYYDDVAASMVDVPKDAFTDVTECAHIIPFAFANFSETQVHQQTFIWDCLYRYFPAVEACLKAETINDTRNAMTLIHSIHLQFGKFQVAFEETETPDVYVLYIYPGFPSGPRKYLPLPQDNIVRMENHNQKYRLPDPILLRVHAAIAKFLHMSGMGEYIDKIMRDRESIRCLAPDGSTDIGTLLAI